MRLGLGVWSLMFLAGVSLPAFAADAMAEEAQRWTVALRSYDRHAKVFTTGQWEKIGHKDAGNVISHLLPGEPAVGYIKIANFDPSTTCRDVRLALKQLERAGARALRLDLRGNPGGQRMMGVCVAGLFVGSKPILGLRDMASPLPNLSELVDEPFTATDSDELVWLHSYTAQETGLPVTVEIDGATGSAAEIVAGAIQDYRRGDIVGERSYGKGSVQECTGLKGRPGLVLCYTVQTFILPSGRCPEGTGITPSISGLAMP